MNLNEVLILTAKNTSIEGKFLTNKGLNVEHVWKNDHFSSRKFLYEYPLEEAKF